MSEQKYQNKLVHTSKIIRNKRCEFYVSLLPLKGWYNTNIEVDENPSNILLKINN